MCLVANITLQNRPYLTYIILFSFILILVSFNLHILFMSFPAIGGVTGELLEQNAQMFNQISANFAAFQVKYIV